MNDKQINQRLLVILGVFLLAMFFLLRWDGERGAITHNLRPGLDIAGGVSMIFEIQQDPDGEQNPYLAEDLKEQLRRRVDPQGVYDLTWRVLGTNRIEVQMPLPPADNKDLRQAYFDADDALRQTLVQRSELEELQTLSGEARTARLDELAGGSPERRALLAEVVARWDALVAARALTAEQLRAEQPDVEDVERALRIAVRDAEEALADARDRVFETNFPLQRFMETRDLDKESQSRQLRIEELKNDYPAIADRIQTAIDAYDAWRGKKRYLESPADLQRLIRGAGVLEFRILVEASPDDAARYEAYRRHLEEQGATTPPPGANVVWLRIDDPLAFFDMTPSELKNLDPQAFEQRSPGFVVGKREDHWYVLASGAADDGLFVQKGPDATKWKITDVGTTRDEAGRPAVSFTFDAIGASLFSELTGSNIARQLCITIDNVAYSSANILSRISRQGMIQGEFSNEKLRYLMQTMQAGVLPAKLKDTPLSERTIGSSLGAANLRHAFTAGIWGLAVVAVVMLLYYRTSGAIAVIAMTMNVLLVLGAMAMIGAQFTLAGIAGVILTIGMTVDANVLIFERMREEKDRGSTLRMIIKNGYDKAFSTIIDANITTLLTCLIIYRVGSEEIKGFGLTLGWGIVTSLFTSLFVTRTLFMLLIKWGALKGVGGLQLIGTPRINWYGMRKFFVPISLTIILVGLGLLYFRGARDTLDVEFLGGVSADIELRQEAATAGGERYNDVEIGRRLVAAGSRIKAEAAQLATAQVEVVNELANTVAVRTPELDPSRLAAYITEPLEAEELIERGAIREAPGGGALLLDLQQSAGAADVQALLQQLGASGRGIAQAGDNIARARVGQVLDNDTEEDRGRFWNITTTVTNRALVTQAIVDAFGRDLVVQPKINYTFHGNADNLPFLVDARQLGQVVPGLPPGASGDLTNFQNGAAMYFADLDPPQPIDALQERLRNMRLAPDFAELPARDTRVLGVSTAGQTADGTPLYDGVVVAVADATVDPRQGDRWEQMARNEYALVAATFDTAQSLQRVTQFKPQIATQATTRALLALILSWGMIIGYMWIRFGKPVYGFAGVVALVHDVCIALAFVGISGWIGGVNHPIGYLLLIDDFKINMTIVAAFLTIIGYSINDTIVVFDRIRETRGRLGVVTPKVINESINQTLSRTIMTSATTLLVLLTMYVFGGQSIRGFNFCMIIGILTGTYSSIAVAAPLLMLRGVEDKPEVGLKPATA